MGGGREGFERAREGERFPKRGQEGIKEKGVKKCRGKGVEIFVEGV